MLRDMGTIMGERLDTGMEVAWKKDNLSKVREAIALPDTRAANDFLWSLESYKLKLLLQEPEPWEYDYGLPASKLLAAQLRLEFRTIMIETHVLTAEELERKKMDKMDAEQRAELAEAAEEHQQQEAHEQWDRDHEADMCAEQERAIPFWVMDWIDSLPTTLDESSIHEASDVIPESQDAVGVDVIDSDIDCASDEETPSGVDGLPL